jgi:hypothetical protein
MTTTTRTTRKAPWAVVTTVLLAVLALVFGAMTLAGPANAKDDNPNKPDNPGNSATANGHDDEFVPPGKVDDGTPGNSAGKVTICHFVHGNGSTGEGYNIITISLNAWEKGHSGGIDDGGNWVHDEKDFVVDATHPCPPVPQCVDGETGTFGGDAKLCKEPPPGQTYGQAAVYTETLCEYTVLVSPVTIASKELTGYGTQNEANLAAGGYWTTLLKSDALTAFLAKPENAAYTMPTMTDTGLVCITQEQAAAIDAALAEPATVAPVLPGTVEEPEAVAVPAPATVPPLPATIPAGDGSGTPTVPTALLALLALGATALAASTVRLVRTTR